MDYSQASIDFASELGFDLDQATPEEKLRFFKNVLSKTQNQLKTSLVRGLVSNKDIERDLEHLNDIYTDLSDFYAQGLPSIKKAQLRA